MGTSPCSRQEAKHRQELDDGRRDEELAQARAHGNLPGSWWIRRMGGGAEEIRSRSGPGRDPDGRLDELMEAATLAPADDRRGGRE